MAQTRRGQKYNEIGAHTRTVNGVPYKVRAHRRSNPRTSRGEATKKARK